MPKICRNDAEMPKIVPKCRKFAEMMPKCQKLCWNAENLPKRCRNAKNLIKCWNHAKIVLEDIWMQKKILLTLLSFFILFPKVKSHIFRFWINFFFQHFLLLCEFSHILM
jgi:hypothetical protein